MELFFLKEKFGYTRYVQGQTLTIEQQLARLLLSPRLSGSLFVSSQTMNLFCSHVPPDIFNRITPLLQLLLPVKYQYTDYDKNRTSMQKISRQRGTR
jgi:hypothetical protein